MFGGDGRAEGRWVGWGVGARVVEPWEGGVSVSVWAVVRKEGGVHVEYWLISGSEAWGGEGRQAEGKRG